MTDRKANNTVLITGIVVSAAALVAGTFIDLDVSKALYQPDSRWGLVGAEYGELPGYIVSMLGVGVFLRMQVATRENAGALALQKVALSIALLAPFFFGSVRVGRYIWEEQQILSGILFGLAVIALVCAVPRERLRPFVPMATAVTFLALINPVLIVLVLKALWGRVRFRDLGPDFADFTVWLLPQGVTGNTSFPSGHTALGWMLLPIAMQLRSHIDVGRWSRTACVAVWIVVLAWGMFVTASRVRVGAHYLTDVSFATLTAFLTTVVITRTRYVAGAEHLAKSP